MNCPCALFRFSFPMKTKIFVTALDIRRGKKQSSSHCPVARAIHRAMGNKLAVVNYENVLIKNVEYPMPPTCRFFISDFDGGAKVVPISFTLRIAG